MTLPLKTSTYADYVQSSFNAKLKEREKQLLNTGLFEVFKPEDNDRPYADLSLQCKCCGQVYEFESVPRSSVQGINAKLSAHFREVNQNFDCLTELKKRNNQLAQFYVARWTKTSNLVGLKSEKVAHQTNTAENDLHNSAVKPQCQALLRSDAVKDFFRFASRFSSPASFPRKQGVYLVLLEIEGKQVILYVGRSINLRERWADHHRQQQLNMLVTVLGDCLSYYALFVSSLFALSEEQLIEIEKNLIRECQPKLNNTLTGR